MLFRRLALASSVILLALGSASAADVKAGKKVFKKCKSCHTVKPEKNKVGPSLHGIIGNASGSVDGYKYSPALASAGIVWTDENMAEFLKNPKEYLPGNKMSFPGLKKDEDIQNLIAYIKDKSN